MTPSILPGNLADLERDLDVALARIGEVEIPIATLWDPWRCPLDVLAYLAWAVSVDQWHSNWPEETKRRVVAGSMGLHRIKGTRPAVEQSLTDLGVVGQVVEWFEDDPPRPPGMFSLRLSTGFKTKEQHEQLIAGIYNAKNTRSHLEFLRSETQLNATLTLGTLVQTATRSSVNPLPPRAQIQPSSLTLAQLVRTAAATRIGTHGGVRVGARNLFQAMCVQSASVVTIGAAIDG